MSALVSLRQQLRTERRALPLSKRQQAAGQLAHRVGALRLFVHTHHLAAYLAFEGEADPAPLLERAWALGKRVYLPVLGEPPSRRLWFAPYQPETVLERNRYGIPEPQVTSDRWLAPHCLDLVLVPLVAFDSDGNRLGMGGGYYDRTFAFRRNPGHLTHPRLLGLAYEFQKVATLPRQPWDVPLDGIATEQVLYTPPGHSLE
jgi:5-formyltetrahydrofolate cyclo-ligase